MGRRPLRWGGLVLVVAAGCSARRAHTSPTPSSEPVAVGAAPVVPVAPVAPAAPAAPVVPLAGAPQTFAGLVKQADGAVVFVKTLQEQRGFTGRRRVVGQGVGSGFVYDPSGLILTNNHVVEDATEIRVVFASKQELPATIVGRDPATDVAVLKVAERGLPALALADSDATRVGDWVVAIGNPFGLSHTVSAGIISAKGRTNSDVQGLGDPSGYYNFLQTDALINPGNSGGPLIDMNGQVVGINTAIRQGSGIGFAIPINMVKELLPMLVKEGRIRRSAIGVAVSSVLEEDSERLRLDGTQGALVRQVMAGGPGERAGLQPDDVILAFEGQEISGPERLRWLASLAGPGKEVTLRVRRGSRSFDLKTILGELPGQERAPAPFQETPGFP